MSFYDAARIAAMVFVLFLALGTLFGYIDWSDK